jgi:hypothetical protein
VDLTWPSSQLRQGRIDDNGGQPGRHFRLPLEFVQMPTSGQECVLDRIFSISGITQVSISPSVKRRQVPRENVLHFPILFFAKAGLDMLFASGI